MPAPASSLQTSKTTTAGHLGHLALGWPWCGHCLPCCSAQLHMGHGYLKTSARPSHKQERAVRVFCPPPHPLSPQAILCRKPGSHLQYIQISFYFYFYFAELQFKSLKLPPERGALQWLLCVACCQTYSHRLGWETRSDVSGIAAAGNKEDGRVAGAVSAPPPAFHTSRSLNVSTGPEWFEILFYLNSLPVTGIF